MSVPSPAFKFDESSGLEELIRIFATQPDDVGLPLAHQAPHDDQESSRAEQALPTAKEEGALHLVYFNGSHEPIAQYPLHTKPPAEAG